MEGLALTAGGDNGDDDHVDRLQHFSRGNANCVEPAPAHMSIADGVAFRLIAAIMNFAVDFDGKPCGQTGEIQTVWA